MQAIKKFETVKLRKQINNIFTEAIGKSLGRHRECEELSQKIAYFVLLLYVQMENL